MFKKWIGVFENFLFGLVGGLIVGVILFALDAVIAFWSEKPLWDNVDQLSKVTSVSDEVAFIVIFWVWVFSIITRFLFKKFDKMFKWADRFTMAASGSLLFVLGFLMASICLIIFIDWMWEDAVDRAVSFPRYWGVSLVLGAVLISVAQVMLTGSKPRGVPDE